MPTDHNIFLKIVAMTAIGCLYAVALAIIWFALETPVAILSTIVLSLYPLRVIRQALMAKGWLKDADDSGLFGALALILLVIGGNNSADLVWIISGGLILCLALSRRPAQPKQTTAPIPSTDIPYRPHRLALIIGGILLLFLAEISGRLLKIELLTHISTHAQFILLIIGLALIVRGVIGNTPRLFHFWGWREIGLIGAIATLGFFLRIYQLQGAQRFLIDEILFIKPIISLWDHFNVALFVPFSNIASFTWLYPYLQQWSIELFGSNLVGLRFVSVVFGTLGIIALYLLARVLLGRRVAVISAFLLATLPVHIQFSRIGINNIADPLFGTLALYFIALAMRQPDRMIAYLGLAGICTGLTQYWYDGGRFIFLALVILWMGGWLAYRVYRAIRHDERETGMQVIKAGAIFVIGFVWVALPVYYTLYALEKPLSNRFQNVGITKQVYNDPDNLSKHIEASLPIIYHFHFSQPESSFYYAGDDPLMPRHTVPFFIGGLWVMGAWLFNRQMHLRQVSILMIIWLGLVWTGNILLETPDISARYVVELPLIALLIALGMDTFATLILKRRAVIIGAVVVVMVGFGVIQVERYFGEHMRRFNYQVRHQQTDRNRDIDDMLLRAVDFSPTTQIYVLDETPFPSSDLDHLLRFYRGIQTGWHYTVYVMPPYDARQTTYLERLSRDVDYLFFVSIITPAGMDQLLLNLFPDIQGPFYTDYVPSMSSQYVMFILPALDASID